MQPGFDRGAHRGDAVRAQFGLGTAAREGVAVQDQRLGGRRGGGIGGHAGRTGKWWQATMRESSNGNRAGGVVRQISVAKAQRV